MVDLLICTCGAEIGAALSVVRTPKAQAGATAAQATPLVISASKAWAGHAEPAAGGYCPQTWIAGCT